jgi:hypothetical protein
MRGLLVLIMTNGDGGVMVVAACDVCLMTLVCKGYYSNDRQRDQVDGF